jgi:hypothetical protein
MTKIIKAGTILVEEGAHLPNSLLLQRESHSSGWSTVKNARSTFDKELLEAGWTYFYMAREIKATVFGFSRQNRLRTALKRLIGKVKSQHCNSIEITQVRNKSFLSVPYLTVCAHARHLQQGIAFSGSS